MMAWHQLNSRSAVHPQRHCRRPGVVARRDKPTLVIAETEAISRASLGPRSASGRTMGSPNQNLSQSAQRLTLSSSGRDRRAGRAHAVHRQPPTSRKSSLSTCKSAGLQDVCVPHSCAAQCENNVCVFPPPDPCENASCGTVKERAVPTLPKWVDACLCRRWMKCPAMGSSHENPERLALAKRLSVSATAVRARTRPQYR